MNQLFACLLTLLFSLSGPAMGKYSDFEQSSNAARAGAGAADDVARLGGRAPDFVVSPGGTAFPVPSGATGPLPTRAPGFQFTGGAGGHGLDSRVTGVRFMDANSNQGARAVYMNQGGQTVNPFTGRTVPKNAPTAHFYIDP